VLAVLPLCISPILIPLAVLAGVVALYVGVFASVWLLSTVALATVFEISGWLAAIAGFVIAIRAAGSLKRY
jgi:hypothetical protein